MNVHANMAYQFKLPTAPRIQVAPPINSRDSEVFFWLRRPDILPASIPDHQPVIRPAGNSWEYDLRHKAQAVVPYLYLGSMGITKDEDFFFEQKITMAFGICQAGSNFMNASVQRINQMSIECQTIEVGSASELITIFDTTNAMMVKHINQCDKAGKSAKIFVFCETGNERSAAIVAAFLLYAHPDLDFIRTIQLCQNQRFCINLDDDLKSTLSNYSDILNARRIASSQGRHPNQIMADGATTRKRGHDELSIEDLLGVKDTSELAVDADDQDRFTGREAQQPFGDDIKYDDFLDFQQK